LSGCADKKALKGEEKVHKQREKLNDRLEDEERKDSAQEVFQI